MSNRPLRGVLDNNVIISGLLLGGVPRKVFDRLLDYGIVLISAEVILELALELNPFHKVEIITPKEFLDRKH